MSDYFTKQRDSGVSGILSSLAPNIPFFLEEVRLTLTGTSPTVTNDFTVTLNANFGSLYDIEYVRQSMSGVTYLIWRPEREVPFEMGDEIDCAWTNQSRVTAALTYLYTPIFTGARM